MVAKLILGIFLAAGLLSLIALSVAFAVLRGYAIP